MFGYIKVMCILCVWYIFFIKSVFRLSELIKKETLISEMLSITEEALIYIEASPLSVEKIISTSLYNSSEYIKKELHNEPYFVDNDVRTFIKQFVKSFSYPDAFSVKSNLNLLKTKLSMLNRKISDKKEEILKTKIIINGLLSVGITILII